MKKLFILALAAVALISVSFGTGCSGSSRNAREIDKVIIQANKIDEDMNEPDDDASDLEWVAFYNKIPSYISQFQAIDTSRCPQDFRVAFEQIIGCMDKSYFEIQKMIDNPEDYFDNPENKTKFESLGRESLKLTQEANLIAAKYGAKERLSYE